MKRIKSQNKEADQRATHTGWTKWSAREKEKWTNNNNNANALHINKWQVLRQPAVSFHNFLTKINYTQIKQRWGLTFVPSSLTLWIFFSSTFSLYFIFFGLDSMVLFHFRFDFSLFVIFFLQPKLWFGCCFCYLFFVYFSFVLHIFFGWARFFLCCCFWLNERCFIVFWSL